jgi:hypothetical protein
MFVGSQKMAAAVLNATQSLQPSDQVSFTGFGITLTLDLLTKPSFYSFRGGDSIDSAGRFRTDESQRDARAIRQLHLVR